MHTQHTLGALTTWPGRTGCLIFIGQFPQKSPVIRHSFCVHMHTPHTLDSLTTWPRRTGCLIFTCHFLEKSPIIRGSFTERDLQLTAFTINQQPIACGVSILQSQISIDDLGLGFFFFATFRWKEMSSDDIQIGDWNGTPNAIGCAYIVDAFNFNVVSFIGLFCKRDLEFSRSHLEWNETTLQMR